MRNSLLISLAIAGLVICSVALSVVVTATATAEAQQDPQQETGMFRVGYAYTTYSYAARDDLACGLVVLETRENWIRVKKLRNSSNCMLRWIVLLDATKSRFRDGRGVWINSDHLLSVVERLKVE
ncbi:hypothetical protein LCGC14_0859870 [marine sediment metagenome]|uniref:Uncharacterized protein n=1 Tax=marine sediment metagenome TaxID=412755 RepID=A0A0F9PT43_9ZZZZ